MDQTFLSVVPEARYSTVGGLYPGYEYTSSDATRSSSLLLAMGRSQFTMYNNMYAFTFGDVRALSGVWDAGKTLLFDLVLFYEIKNESNFNSIGQGQVNLLIQL